MLSRKHSGWFLLLLIMFLGVSGAAVAQSEGGTGEEAQASGEASVPSFQETRYFDSWRVDCFDKEYDGYRCQLQQQITELSTGQLIAQIVLFKNTAEDNFRILARFPLLLDLKKGVLFKLADLEEPLVYSYCDTSGCYVDDMISNGLINAFKAEAEGTVEIVSREGSTLPILFSLKGFTNAFNYLSDKN